MKESIKNGIRVLFKTGVSALAGLLTANGVDVDPNFVVVVVGTAAGAANWLLNSASRALLASDRVPDLVKTAVKFLWAPPEYQT